MMARAAVAYLDDAFRPVKPAQATVVKIIYPKGNVIFVDYDPDQPRHPAGDPRGGQWTNDPNQMQLPLEGGKEGEAEGEYLVNGEMLTLEQIFEGADATNDDPDGFGFTEEQRKYVTRQLQARSLTQALTESERSALRSYSDSGYLPINRHLRGTLDEAFADWNQEILDNLDSAVNKASLREPIKVYRGLKPHMEDLLAKNVGGEFIDKGFVSASLNSHVAADTFSSSQEDFVVINLPKGAKAMPMGADTVYPKEYEVLIKRGSRFRIDSPSSITLLPDQTQDYDPDQPRVPAGDPEGGQWTDDTVIVGAPIDADRKRWRKQLAEVRSADLHEQDQEGAFFIEKALEEDERAPLSERKFGRFAAVTDREGAIQAAGYGKILRSDNTTAQILFLGSVKRGAGAKALRAVEDRLTQSLAGKKLKQFVLKASEENKSFYLRQGYKSDGDDDFPEYTMRKSIMAVRDYDPDQPRKPKGDPEGGQWTTEWGGAKSKFSQESGRLETIQQVVQGQIDDGIEPRILTVQIKRLYATQSWLEPNRNLRASIPVFEDYDDLLVVARDAKGINHLLDGHHRAAALVRAGKKSTRAYVFDIPNLDDIIEDFDPDQPRDPKGTPTGGRWTSTGPDINQSLDKEGKPVQPVRTLDELYARAKEEEAAFTQTIDAFALDTGGTASYTSPAFAEPGTILKAKASAIRKLGDELDGDVTRLRDVLRATITYDTVKETRQGAATFMKQLGDDLLRVKDRIATPLASGYRDLLVNFRTPGGLVAELQFVSDDMLATKLNAGHLIYEQLRVPNLDYDVAFALSDKAEIIYADAYKRDGNGNWGRR